MRLGCCINNFNSWSFEEAVRLSHDLGFRFGNIGLGQLGGIDAVMADPEAVASRIRKAAQTYRFEFSELMLFGLGPAEGADDPLASAAGRFEQICRCMAAAGLKSVLGQLKLPATKDAGDADEAWDQRVALLRQAVEIARREGLLLNIEPGFTGDLVRSPETALRLLDAVPDLGLSLDFCHFLAAGVPIEKGFCLLPRARQLHLKQAARGYIKSFFHQGEVDYAAIVGELRRIGWSGEMVLECLAFTQDERYEWQTYAAVRNDWGSEAGEGLLTHPAFQTIALAYEIERLMLESEEN